jgi:hypothetical protein
VGPDKRTREFAVGDTDRKFGKLLSRQNFTEFANQTTA